MLSGIVSWILSHKLVVFLSVALFAFFVSTIAVAVEKDNYKDELATCQMQLTTTTTNPTTITDPTTTTTTDSTKPEENTTDGSITTPGTQTQNYRLPDNVLPDHYHILLNPDLVKSTFTGKVDITLSVKSDTMDIIMHNNNLTVDQISLWKADEEIKPIRHFTSDNDTEFFHVQTESVLTPGRYKLMIEYSGTLDGIVGFYSSTYNGTTIATSKFEPTYARQAFPCFDEPAMKANYTVELVAPKDYIALSNMNVVNRTDYQDSGNDLWTFAESVKMSTYLACFIVCDFDFKNMTVIGNDTSFPFRVYATKDQIDKVDFSLEFGKNVTEYYIKYFEIDYPLPKLDMIAIPDFVSGAMEHWGLVTYRETNLLYDSTSTPTANLQSIARVVAHEISHMWFGNLVTMKWWNELWLNEGFASYMQYKACNEIFPEWEFLDQFLTANSHSIYALDGTLNSHPIVQTVETPDEITAIFDSVTYNKGAAVIRMLEDFVGSENFRMGVSNYLKINAFGNTITQDLLDELEKVYDSQNGRNVTYIMDTWTRQMGLPVVNVKQESPTTYTLTQKRFLANPDVKLNTELNYKWEIPIRYRIKGEPGSQLIWFSDTEENLKIELKSDQKILKVNLDQIGYYRVNYDEVMWTELESELNDLTKTELSKSDRAHLLNDIFNLAEASEVSYDKALTLSTYLKNETDYVPWAVGASVYSNMKTIMSNSESYIEFRSFIRELLSLTYDAIADENNLTHVQKLLKSTIYELACSMGSEECLSKVENDFKNYLNNDTKIEPDLKTTVYYYGVFRTGETEWLKLWDKFTKESDPIEKNKLMSSLAGSNDPSILKRYLNLAWDENFIRSQDHLNVLQFISNNPIGAPLVWDHVRENWPRLVDKFTLNSRTLGNTIPAITRSFATALKLEEIEEFFTKYPAAGAGATARLQTKERVMNNIKWLEKHEPTVSAWLKKRKI